jgi:hypothetical protein
MSKASTRMLEQGIQAPSLAPDLIPAETSIENLHRDWYYERGHVSSSASYFASLRSRWRRLLRASSMA